MKILRILSVFAFLVFVLVAAFPATAGQIRDQVLEISVQRANVRDMPSLQGEVIFQVSLNERLRVVQKEGNWYWVENSTGRRGYISSTVVRVVAAKIDSNVPPIPTPQPSSGTFRNSDVIAMAKAGLSDSIIVVAIRQSDSVEFNLSPAGLIALKDGGVSEAVIQAMLDLDAVPSGVTEAAAPVEQVLPQRPVARNPVSPQAGNSLVGASVDFADWTRQLDEARRRRSRGIRFFIAGAGVAVAAPIIVVNVATARAAGLMSLGGAGLAIYGIYNWYTASERIDDLDRDGRINGYLTLVPLREGVAAYATFTF